MRILIADDDQDIREVLSLILEAEGHQISTAADGEEALNKIRGGEAPALILLDLMMPKVDGDGVMAELRRDPLLARIPVVIISGHQAARQKASRLGAVQCLVKPIELQALDSIMDGMAGARP